MYLSLSDEERLRLNGHVQVFLDEKSFEGCNGFELTEEVRLTIAVQACFLILNHKYPSYYPGVSSILVYPAAFKVPVYKESEAGTINESKEVVAGVAWKNDLLILSWSDVLQGARNDKDGRNVVFHEFAHQLDVRDGYYDGVPILPRKSMYQHWERIFSREYERFVRASESGEKTFLDEYGATNRAEFFAVSTEHFFEQPKVFKEKHRDLYELFKVFYQQDPIARLLSSYRSSGKSLERFELPSYIDWKFEKPESFKCPPSLLESSVKSTLMIRFVLTAIVAFLAITNLPLLVAIFFWAAVGSVAVCFLFKFIMVASAQSKKFPRLP
jgi:hypothetical protein